MSLRSLTLDSQSQTLLDLGRSMLHADWFTDVDEIYSLGTEIGYLMTRHFSILGQCLKSIEFGTHTQDPGPLS